MRAKQRGTMWALGLGALGIPACLLAVIFTLIIWPQLKLIIGVLLLLIPLKILLTEHISYKSLKPILPPILLWIVVGGCILASVFFDVYFLPDILPELSAREFGVLTSGTITDHRTRTGNRKSDVGYYVYYEFTIEGVNQKYSRAQEINQVAKFDQLQNDMPVNVYYLPFLPTISVMEDEEHLKFNSIAALAISMWGLLVIFLFIARDFIRRKV